MKPNIVLITGHARNGKTESAKYIQKILTNCHKKVALVNYADYLKYLALSQFGWSGVKDEAGRTLLQNLGSDVRTVNPDFWIEIVYMTVCTVLRNFDYVVIADCRYPNEVEYWENHGFNVTKIRVIREGNFTDLMTEKQRKHESETALDDYPMDYIIRANTLDSLKESLSAIFIDDKVDIISTPAKPITKREKRMVIAATITTLSPEEEDELERLFPGADIKYREVLKRNMKPVVGETRVCIALSNDDAFKIKNPMKVFDDFVKAANLNVDSISCYTSEEEYTQWPTT